MCLPDDKGVLAINPQQGQQLCGPHVLHREPWVNLRHNGKGRGCQCGSQPAAAPPDTGPVVGTQQPACFVGREERDGEGEGGGQMGAQRK